MTCRSALVPAAAVDRRSTSRRRTLLVPLLSLAALAVIDWESAGAFTPDTGGYLAFSPFRQPLYGLFANGVHGLFGSWAAVGQIQILCLLGALAIYYLELARCNRWGWVGALIAATAVLLLLRLGVSSLVPILVTEGLFLPGLILLAAVVLRMGRLRRVGWEAHLATLVLFVLVQLRPAALLTLCIPPLAVLLLLRQQPGRASRATGAKLLATFMALLTFGPFLQGKSLLQVGTRGDSLGFALIGRISQVTPPAEDQSVPQAWAEMAQSWQAIASRLDLTEAALFDAQIQEAVRFALAPGLLLSSGGLGATSDSSEFDWAEETDRLAARRLSLDWILADPVAYAKWSLIHFFGTMTAATYASERQRKNVVGAIREVDPRVWDIARFRDDYPNNRFDLPLKPRTAVVYLMIRGFAALGLIVGGAVTLVFVIRAIRRRKTDAATAVAAAGWMWLCAHGAVVGLMVFPEFRFVHTSLLGYLVFGIAVLVLAMHEGSPFGSPDGSVGRFSA